MNFRFITLLCFLEVSTFAQYLFIDVHYYLCTFLLFYYSFAVIHA